MGWPNIQSKMREWCLWNVKPWHYYYGDGFYNLILYFTSPSRIISYGYWSPRNIIYKYLYSRDIQKGSLNNYWLKNGTVCFCSNFEKYITSNYCIPKKKKASWSSVPQQPTWRLWVTGEKAEWILKHAEGCLLLGDTQRPQGSLNCILPCLHSPKRFWIGMSFTEWVILPTWEQARNPTTLYMFYIIYVI